MDVYDLGPKGNNNLYDEVSTTTTTEWDTNTLENVEDLTKKETSEEFARQRKELEKLQEHFKNLEKQESIKAKNAQPGLDKELAAISQGTASILQKAIETVIACQAWKDAKARDPEHFFSPALFQLLATNPETLKTQIDTDKARLEEIMSQLKRDIDIQDSDDETTE